MAVVVVVVAEFGVSRGRAARARAGLKQAWRAGSGIVKPNCDGFGSGGGACIVAAGDACVVCRVCWLWWARSTAFVGRRPVCSGQRERRGHAPCERVVAALQGAEGTAATSRMVSMVSSLLHRAALLLLLSCRAARLSLARCRSTASDASHPSLSPSACRCCSYCPYPPPRTPSLVRDRAPSTLHRTAPPALSRNGRLTPVVRNARWLRPKIAPPSHSQSSSLVRRQSGRLARY
jgi:hypothetical protein